MIILLVLLIFFIVLIDTKNLINNSDFRPRLFVNFLNIILLFSIVLINLSFIEYNKISIKAITYIELLCLAFIISSEIIIKLFSKKHNIKFRKYYPLEKYNPIFYKKIELLAFLFIIISIIVLFVDLKLKFHTFNIVDIMRTVSMQFFKNEFGTGSLFHVMFLSIISCTHSLFLLYERNNYYLFILSISVAILIYLLNFTKSNLVMLAIFFVYFYIFLMKNNKKIKMNKVFLKLVLFLALFSFLAFFGNYFLLLNTYISIEDILDLSIDKFGKYLLSPICVFDQVINENRFPDSRFFKDIFYPIIKLSSLGIFTDTKGVENIDKEFIISDNFDTGIAGTMFSSFYKAGGMAFSIIVMILLSILMSFLFIMLFLNRNNNSYITFFLPTYLIFGSAITLGFFGNFFYQLYIYELPILYFICNILINIRLKKINIK